MAIVYRHIRLDKNEPFYIGIGETEKRARSIKNRNKYWKNIVSKTEYEVEILFNDLTWDEACEKEKEFIKLYGRFDLGIGILVNMTDGGDGISGHKMNEEAINKIKIKRASQVITEKHKIAISIANTGKKRDEEHRMKTSIARKTTNGMKGKKPWNYGLKGAQKATEEQLINIRNAQKARREREKLKKDGNSITH
jgi:hypothetical protein